MSERLDGGEVSSEPSNVVAAATAADPAPPPAAPVGLFAFEATADRVELRWDEASLDESEFRVYRRAAGAAAWGPALARVTADARAFPDTSVSAASGDASGFRTRSKMRARSSAGGATGATV